MFVKVSSLGSQPVSLWNYMIFEKIHFAALRTIKRTGHYVDYMVFETDKSIDDELTKELNLQYCIIDRNQAV